MADDNVPAAVRDAIAYVREETIAASGAADRIITLCTKCVTDAAQDDFGDEDSTPGLEDFLWTFWEEVFHEIVSSEPKLHDRLIDTLKNIKRRGKAGAEGWRVWGTDMSWEDLPLFGAVARENFNGVTVKSPDGKPLPVDSPEALAFLAGDRAAEPEDPTSALYVEARKSWLNRCRFLMQVWVSDVYDFELYGLWMMREGLEDFDLDRLGGKTDHSNIPVALAIEEASVCIQVAAEKMYRSKLIAGPKGSAGWDPRQGAPGRGGKRWQGVDGYHPDRWKLWKTIFKEIVDAKGRPGMSSHVVEAAQAAIDVMNSIEAQEKARSAP